MTAAGGVPVLRGAAEAFGAIAAVARWERRRQRRLERGPVRAAGPPSPPTGHASGTTPPSTGLLAADATVAADEGLGRATTTLSEAASLARLAAAGLPVVATSQVGDAESAVLAAREVGLPVVLKVDADGLAHKSDIGGVRVGLIDDAAVRAAAVELLALPLPPGAERRGLLVAAHLDGVELILGGRRDPSYGPLVIVGFGGVFAEVLDDVSVRLAPVDADEAAGMLDGLRGAPILAGVRGRPGIDRAAVVDAIVALGRLLMDRPAIIALDANPLISGPAGTAIVDALIVEER